MSLICDFMCRLHESTSNVSSSQIHGALRNYNISNILERTSGSLDADCMVRAVECDRTNPFRSISGWCNNLNYPGRGSAYSTFLRIRRTNAYHDGYDSPRKESAEESCSGDYPDLPSPREVANAVHGTTEHQDTQHTQLLFQWGQFLDHDLTLTPFVGFELSAPDRCANCDSSEKYEECFPIPVPHGDPVFPNGSCIQFIRSANSNNRLGIKALEIFHKLGPREALNQVTSYLDGSQIYGSEVSIAQSLRDINGKLRSQRDGTLLPNNPDQTGCNPKTKPNLCFLAGDIRNTEQNGLTSMHTLWMQEHNKIAEELSRLNPTWDSDRVYLETRRIAGALLQRITYDEFLPEIIGQKMMERYQIVEEPQKEYFHGYKSGCDATTFTEFSTAAMRFGHSLVNARFKVKTPGEEEGSFDLATNFFNPSLLYQNPLNAHGIIAGFANQSNLKMDRLVHNTLRNRLFEVSEGKPFDLAALNIQRGRDHGIPPYLSYRIRRSFTPWISTFDDLRKLMSRSTVNALRGVYRSPKDIDLWTGIVAEISETPEAVLGQTGAHILGRQFKKLKHCDRFFYSNEPSRNPGSFCEDQLAEIRKMKLSNIICHNAKDISIQPSVMRGASQRNKIQPCTSYTHLNLSKWLESECQINYVEPDYSRNAVNPARCIPEEPGNPDIGVSFYRLL